MGMLRTLAAAAAIAGLAALAAPSAAQAATDAGDKNTAAPYSTAAADGFLYAAADPYGQGDYCRWLDSDKDWSTCQDAAGHNNNLRNHASQMWNNGVPGGYDDVKVYWDINYNGAWRCLPNGSHWDDLPLDRETFDHGSPGYGESLNDNVSSHQWVNAC